MVSSSYKRSPQRPQPERLVAEVMREEAKLERAVRAKALVAARLRLANVLTIGKAIAQGVAPSRDIFGLDDVRGEATDHRNEDQLFGELP